MADLSVTCPGGRRRTKPVGRDAGCACIGDHDSGPWLTVDHAFISFHLPPHFVIPKFSGQMAEASVAELQRRRTGGVP